MNVKGIIWLGTRTAQFEQMNEFCRSLLGLSQTSSNAGLAVFQLPDGDIFEIFDARHENFKESFMNHPVAGFLVDDIVAARAEMESKGIQFIGPIEGETDEYKWTHFRAPDGFVYELTYSTAHPSIAE